VARFVVIGQTATASADFSLEDLAGSSGRLDVLLRCVRAALLCSHGVRRDVTVYLVLLGGPEAPRVVRVEGATAKFLRPDERPLATLVKKALGAERPDDARGFVERRHGIAVADAGLEAVVADMGRARPFLLDEGGVDIRDLSDTDLEGDTVFFVGDHLGISPDARRRVAEMGGRAIAVGPESLHSDDVVTLVTNEIDRRRPRGSAPAGL
jgi:tRNA (pseudouridine54-N1)-methyltransferase